MSKQWFKNMIKDEKTTTRINNKLFNYTEYIIYLMGIQNA